MQQEDDLRGLAKVMDFMRALSILFVVINIYWYCYQQMVNWGINIGVVDKILVNFDRTAGLFHNILWSKLFTVVFLALSCLGTRGVKEEKITWNKIIVFLSVGFVLFFFNWWLLDLPLPLEANAGFYILTMSVGYILLLMGGTWMSRLLKNNMMDDVFNVENESFQQETRLMENEYSVNLPTRFYYRKKWNNGWINVVNPFRASIVLGTPGSGKSYAVVNQYIKQQIEKGYSLYCYDFKYPDLSTIAYSGLIERISRDLENFKSRVQLNEDGSYKNPIQLNGVQGGDIKFIGKHLNHIADTARTGNEFDKIGSLYGFDLLVKSETSQKEGFDAVQNRFYVRGEGDYLYQYNYGNLASDPRLAAQNFINALGTIEPTLEKFQKENEKLSKDIPTLKEVVEGTWRKEPELAALREEFKELDRKIQLSLKPIEESEGQPVNEVAADKQQAPEDSRQPTQTNNGQQPYVPARLREIADNSGGRVVIGTVGGSPPKVENPVSKGIKL